MARKMSPVPETRPGSDARRAFPDTSGLAPRNLGCTRTFAAACPDPAVVQHALHYLPWSVSVELEGSVPTVAQIEAELMATKKRRRT